jgi:hypothetical protein
VAFSRHQYLVQLFQQHRQILSKEPLGRDPAAALEHLPHLKVVGGHAQVCAHRLGGAVEPSALFLGESPLLRRQPLPVAVPHQVGVGDQLVL